MQIHINGKQQNILEPISVADLLTSLNIENKRIAVELNQEIIPRSEHRQIILKEGDVVEVIQAIAGG